MHIVKLIAENVKRLKAVAIEADGNVMKITGKNGQGKTSTIDAIWLALGGDAAVRGTKTTRPIRDGAKQASVVLDLGELIVTRTWTANDKPPTLKLESKDGTRFASPQAMLNDLVGNLAFDPLAFMRMDGKKQTETLLALVGIDAKKLDEQRKLIFEDRTILNRQVKELKATLGAFNPHENEGNLPDKEVSSAQLMKEYQAATETIAANNRKRTKLEDMRNQALSILSEQEQIEQEIKKLQERHQALGTKVDEIRTEGKKLGAEVELLQDPDMKALRERMTTVEETNVKIRERNRHIGIYRNLLDAELKSKELTLKIEALDNKKVDAIRRAKLPVDGLGFTEEGVTFNGIPLPQASHSEQIRVSMAMGMSLNPQLRVMLVKNGNDFDSDSLQIVEDMARDNDYQIWMEMVDETGKVGVYIEDGEVKQYVTA